MNKLINNIKSKNSEQIFSLCLLIACFSIMLFCAIVRICGGLWFTADLGAIPVPNEFWQAFIMACLFAFEMAFVYKILCRCKWKIAVLLSILHTIITAFIPTELWTNIFNLLAILFVPVLYTRKLVVVFDSIFLYALELLYSVLFLVGRAGNLDTGSAYIFIYNVFGVIDFKLFIVSIYLFIKYYGGIQLWKNQKRLLFQNSLMTKEML